MPASPKAPKFLVGKKEKQPSEPIVPADRLQPSVAPIACAASSITAIPCLRAVDKIPSISAHFPKRCTGRIALQREPIFDSRSVESKLKWRLSMSTNTGRAPRREITPAVAKKENVL